MQKLQIINRKIPENDWTNRRALNPTRKHPKITFLKKVRNHSTKISLFKAIEESWTAFGRKKIMGKIEK